MTTSWHAGQLTANGIRLHYTRTGGAYPPVVLAHGFSDDGLCWTSLARALAADFDVVLVDARGHGRSEAPATGYGPLEHAEDLAGLINGLALSPPIIIGHSMGALTALTLAGRHPTLPRAIVLEDPPPAWSSAAEPLLSPAWRKQTGAWIAGLAGQTLEAIIAAQRAAAPAWPEADLAPWAEAKLRLSPRVLEGARTPDIDWPQLLSAITCPALLLTADPELGALITPAQAEALRTHIPHLRHERFTAAGHSLRRDQSERYLQTLRAFFQTV